MQDTYYSTVPVLRGSTKVDRIKLRSARIDETRHELNCWGLEPVCCNWETSSVVKALGSSCFYPFTRSACFVDEPLLGGVKQACVHSVGHPGVSVNTEIIHNNE